MKKVYLSLMLSLLCLVSVMAKEKPSLATEGPKITITVEIGRRPGCVMAWAICDFTIGGLGLAANAESLPGGGGGGGSWILTLPRDNFAKQYPAYLSKLDGKSTVTFESSFIVPVDVQKALGSPKELVIQGNVAYPLKYVNGEFVMTFPL